MSGKPLASLALRARSLEWATPGRTPDKAATIVVGRAEIDLGEGQKDLIAGLRTDRDRLVQGIRKECDRLPAQVVLGIPASWVLLRVADLPTTEPAERRGMMELQVDKFSPFPADESVISGEVLMEKDGRSRVLLSAIPTATMNLVGDALREAGIHLNGVDVNLLGWWRVLKDAGKVSDTGSQAFAILDDQGCDLMVTTAGVPVAIRSLSGLEDLPVAEFAEEVAREVVFTLASLDLERSGEPLSEVAVWHRGDPPKELLHRLTETFSVTAHPYALESLPSLSEGLLRRARSRKPGMLDLAPPDWQKAEKSSIVRRRMIAVSATVLGLWGLAIATLFGGLQIQKQRLATQEATLAALTASADHVRDVRDRAQSLEQYIDRSHSALECLREISERLAPGIEFRSFTYHKGKTVELIGEADAFTLVSDFKKEMDASKMFVSNSLPRITHTAQNKENFKLTAVLPGGAKP
jgi:Tfp pilus assembly protein PilN